MFQSSVLTVVDRFDGHYSGQQGLLRRRGVVSNHHSLHAEIQDIQQVNTGGLVCPTHTATLLTNLPTECIYIDIYCLLCEYIFLHFNLRLQLGVLEDVSSPVYVGQSSNSQRDDLQHIIHRIKSAEVTHMLHSNYPDWVRRSHTIGGAIYTHTQTNKPCICRVLQDLFPMCDYSSSCRILLIHWRGHIHIASSNRQASSSSLLMCMLSHCLY